MNRYFTGVRLGVIGLLLAVSMVLGACDNEGMEGENGVGIEEGIGGEREGGDDD